MTNKLTNQISNGVPQQQSSAMTQTQTIKHTQPSRAQAAVIRTQGGAWPGQAGWARLGGVWCGCSGWRAGPGTQDTSASKRSIRRFVITEKAPTRAFSWLKAATTAFTFKTLLRHYAKRALTPQSLNIKLGPPVPYDNCIVDPISR